MAAYSSQTVNDLKTELKARGLPTSGNKSDLIARLEENDAAKEETKPETEEEPVEAAPEPVVEAVAEKKEEETVPVVEAAAAAAPVTTTTTTESKPEEKKEEEKKVKEYTPEERKTMALEMLNKKLKRAIKFGTDTEDLKKQIDRVEKFGVEVNTSLAREIGITSGDRELGRGRPQSHGRRRH